MCAIIGGNNPDWDYNKGIESMEHRGPDGMTVKPFNDFTLAFARLAVMDLTEHGMQPMFSDDKQVCIVYNGEIYGYQKLKDTLIHKGYQFHSQSDTEVILNAYLEWGGQFIHKIDGMYGIAIYDKRNEKILLYRDRIGIKPVYYLYDGVNFGFASELKGILNMCSTVLFEYDNTAVYDFLNYSYIPEPKTYYKNVYKLLPGHCLIFDIRQKRILNNCLYWKLKVNSFQGRQRKQSDLIEEVKYLVKKSVQQQMIADVPVGTFLSGGVDSSIVTYEGYKINPQIQTFSMGFTNADYDESKYACELAEKYQIPMNLKMFGYDDFNRNYNKLKVWYDEPFADTSAFPTYRISKMAKEKVTAVLTGDGGDEIFGGYDRYQAIWKKEKEKGPDHLLISAIYLKYRISTEKDYFWLDDLTCLLQMSSPQLFVSDKELRRRLKIDKDYDKLWAYRKYYNKALPPITRAQYLDLKTYLPGDILTKVDRAGMAVSLETRLPLLARRLVEFSFSLSAEDRCPHGCLKGLLKKAYQEQIGRKIFNRPKMGFVMPHNYLGKKKAPQESLLEEIWKYKY